MVARLEELPGLAGFEVGLPPDIDSSSAAELALAALGELPVVLRLPMESATDLAPSLAGIGLAAVSLSPPRGVLPAPDGELVAGRLYGPPIFPIALSVLRTLLDIGLPVFASGGVYYQEQVETLIAAGAAAVQLDAVLWREGW